MRLGLIGLGRIGSFHADTLSQLPGGRLPGRHRCRARGHQGRRRAGRRGGRRHRRRACISSGVDGDRHRRGHQRPHPADQGRGRRRHPGVLREAAVRRPCRGRRHRPVRQRQRGAGADRLPAPLRPGVRRRPRGRGRRGARLGPHRPVDHPGPGTRAARVHRGVRRDLPGLQRARLRHRPVGHRPGGRRGLRHRQRQGRRLLRRVRRRRHRADAADLRRRRHRGGVQHPLQRPRLRRPAGAARHRRQRRRRLERHHPAAQPRTRRQLAGRATGRRSSWTGSPAPSAPSSSAFTEVVAGQRTSPCTVDDALAVAYIAEAATLSLQQHRPVQIDEVRQ